MGNAASPSQALRIWTCGAVGSEQRCWQGWQRRWEELPGVILCGWGSGLDHDFALASLESWGPPGERLFIWVHITLPPSLSSLGSRLLAAPGQAGNQVRAALLHVFKSPALDAWKRKGVAGAQQRRSFCQPHTHWWKDPLLDLPPLSFHFPQKPSPFLLLSVSGAP